MIRVLVVDDSPFFRKAIARILEKDPEIEVAGFATNGLEAVEKVMELSPDVVTLDLEMPIADGFTAIKEIMKKKPTPILVVSALTREGAKETIKALELGAVDFVFKNVDKGILGFYDMESDLINKVKSVAKKKPIYQVKEAKGTQIDSFVMDRKRDFSVIGIGSSTGGPNALKVLLGNLKKTEVSQPILIAQHMPPLFTAMLAERLNEVSELHVKEAEDGEPVEESVVYVAPGGKVMEVSNKGKVSIRIREPEPTVIYRPSVDILFKSLADVYGGGTLGVVLTGMGNDGAQGSAMIKSRGGVVIVESEDTAVVYGMPRSVYEKGLADFKVPLQEIPDLIKKLVNRGNVKK